MAGSLLLAAALSAQVAITSFDVEGGRPPGFGRHLANVYLAALKKHGCADGRSGDGIDPAAAAEIVNCIGSGACIARVGRRLGMDFVIHGTVKRFKKSAVVSLDIVDVARERVGQHLDQAVDVDSSRLLDSVEAVSSVLCGALSPSTTATQSHTGGGDLPIGALVVPLPSAATNTDSPKPPTAAGASAGPAPLSLVAQQPTAPPPGDAVGIGEAGARPAPSPLPPSALAAPPTGPAMFLGAVPWSYVVLGGAVVAGIVGAGLGGASASTWSRDRPMTMGGIVYHSITLTQATSANGEAVGADVCFSLAGALALGGGAMVLYRW